MARRSEFLSRLGYGLSLLAIRAICVIAALIAVAWWISLVSLVQSPETMSR